MKMLECATVGDIAKYIEFMNHVYKNDPCYRKSMLPIVKMILRKKSVFAEHAVIQPVIVYKNRLPVVACTCITTPKLANTMQISFFEALPDEKPAVDFFIQKMIHRCQELGLQKMIFGLNGHVNYGMGLLTDHFDHVPTFGSPYNPPYYVDYLQQYSTVEWNMSSFLTDMDRFDMLAEGKLIQRVKKSYRVRVADFKHLSREVAIYTRLNNECFCDHPFYFERTFNEDYELLNGFKPLIKGENLLILETMDGCAAGFMLWYPDYHQLIKPGRGVGVDTLIKNTFFSSAINKFKIAEIGILPQYQGTGAAALLFEKCMELTKGKYKWCESSWIMDENTRSRGFGTRWADCEYKHYSVYEMIVDEITVDERTLQQ